MTSSAPAASPVGLSPSALGRIAAVVTVSIWTAFIVIARATADPARGGTLLPLDVVYVRLWGAALVLLPWGWWMTRAARQQADPLAPGRGSLGGVSPLPWAITWRIGLFGGLLYATLAYSGFVFAPAAHASVWLPGSLPLWTTLLALLLLGERISWGRALGLGLIVCGDALVGGASLLNAFDGSGVWRGDVLFVLAAMCWSTAAKKAASIVCSSATHSALGATCQSLGASFSVHSSCSGREGVQCCKGAWSGRAWVAASCKPCACRAWKNNSGWAMAAKACTAWP